MGCCNFFLMDFWNRLAPGETSRDLWTPFNGCEAVPVLAMRGAKDGPTFLVTGGVHGDEYEGPFAAASWFSSLNVSHLCGRVLVLPIINGEAWRAKTRRTPRDNGDLNRCFNLHEVDWRDQKNTMDNESSTRSPMSDAMSDSYTRRLAESVFQAFVSCCDALCDLHSGGAALVHWPLLGWYGGDTHAETWARRAEPMLHPWRIPDAPGVLSYEAHRTGKLAWGAEWGGGARLDLDGAAAYSRALNRLAAQLEMLNDELSTQDTRAAIAGDYQITKTGGLFAPTVSLGEQVREGTVLGNLHDFTTGEKVPLFAERDGLVAGLPHVPLLRAGDRVAYIG